MSGNARAKFRGRDLLPGPIRGITRTSLWKSWKDLRKELKKSSVRDIVDFIDFDVNPDVWINRLLARVASGSYEPEVPIRFTLGKSKGFSRTMTLPAVPDLVLYRTIVNYLYNRSRGRHHKNVYFLQDTLTKIQRAALSEGKNRMEEARDFEEVEGQYRFTGRQSFYNWLRFSQYRKHLIYEEAHEVIVVTDIANFFDTVLHSHVTEAVQTLNVPPRMIGLLFFLLEHLSIRQDYSSSHGISLPTDEFDCSRTLAHMVLYPHDDAMVQLVGEAMYVRWMDDQNMAVQTKAEGLNVLREVGRSLARLHLTPNGQKSKVMTLEEARRHYHLDINDLLDEADSLGKKVAESAGTRRRFQSKVRGIWRKARRYEGIGEFGKILKRLYRLAGLARLDIFRDRAARDLLSDPALVNRIADYYRCTGTVSEYLGFVKAVMTNPEQIYPDVNIALVESLLRLEPVGPEIKELRDLTKKVIRREDNLPGAEQCTATATLLTLRLGSRGFGVLLKRCFETKKHFGQRPVVRAAAIVYASQNSSAYDEVRKVASTLLRNHLSTLVLLIAEIKKYESVPDRYRNRLKSLGWDSVAGRKFIDMRVILIARLLLLNESQGVRAWLIDWRNRTLKEKISAYDRRMLLRLVK